MIDTLLMEELYDSWKNYMNIRICQIFTKAEGCIMLMI